MQPYGWKDDAGNEAMAYLAPIVISSLAPPPLRVIDIGSGNGWLAGQLARRGYDVVGIERDAAGVRIAREAWPAVEFIQGDVESLEFEAMFDAAVSTEVIEHLYDPVAFVAGSFRALRPGGLLLVSTPYHGYAKNLALALAGAWDKHLQPQRVGGHVKFWSRHTLRALLRDAGFEDVRFKGAGRLPYLWKSDVVLARRP